MKSQYLELKAIADNMYRLAQEAFIREKQEAIDWILAQMSLFGISFENLQSMSVLDEAIKPDEVKPNLDQIAGLGCHEEILMRFKLRAKAREAFLHQLSWNFADSKTNGFLQATASINKGINKTENKSVMNYAIYKVSIDGVLYNNAKHAGGILELHCTSVTRRCLSPNEKFKDWFLVSKDTGQPIPKMNAPRKRRLKTEEEKKKISESLTKFNADLSKHDHRSFTSHSIDSNKKLSLKLKGRKLSEDTKEKMKLEAATRPFPRGFGQPVRINGINYNTLTAASKVLAIPIGTILSRCRNKREEFKEWMYLPLNIEMLKQA